MISPLSVCVLSSRFSFAMPVSAFVAQSLLCLCLLAMSAMDVTSCPAQYWSCLTCSTNLFGARTDRQGFLVDARCLNMHEFNFDSVDPTRRYQACCAVCVRPMCRLFFIQLQHYSARDPSRLVCSRCGTHVQVSQHLVEHRLPPADQGTPVRIDTGAFKCSSDCL